MSENTGGKGSKPRPILDKESFEKNWDAIFGSTDTKEKEMPEKGAIDG